MAEAASSAPGKKKALTRLSKELAELKKTPLPFATVDVQEDDIYHWHANLTGPAKTPYEGGIFKVELKFSSSYPISPPEAKFITKIYHPNVSVKNNGAICANIIKKDWSPVLKISHILERLYTMLKEPSGDDPLDADIGEVFNTQKPKFLETAKQWTKKFAS